MTEIVEEKTSIMPTDVELDAIWIKPSGIGPFSCIVMIHGFGALKEMSLTDTARDFAKAGYACLLYDHRNLGHSGGEPRQEIDPWLQVRDLRGALTIAATAEDVNPETITVWGTSYAAGVAIVVAAVDARVRSCIAQVPFVSGKRTLERMFPAAQWPQIEAGLEADKLARLNGAEPVRRPISEEGSEGQAWAAGASKGLPYRNEMTLQSVEHALYFEPIDFIERIAPKPLLVMAAKKDVRTPTDLQMEAFERAREPKELVWLEGGHYDAYLGERDRATAAALTFLETHMPASQSKG